MKTILTSFLMLLISVAFTYGQKKNQNIRFIHGGEELKPVGTLLISTNDTLRPNDKTSDKFFGRAIKTDERSFDILNEFITQNRYLFKNKSRLTGSNEYFIIKYSNGSKLFLKGGNINSFFSSLRFFLKKKNVDMELVTAFDYY